MTKTTENVVSSQEGNKGNKKCAYMKKEKY